MLWGLNITTAERAEVSEISYSLFLLVLVSVNLITMNAFCFLLLHFPVSFCAVWPAFCVLRLIIMVLCIFFPLFCSMSQSLKLSYQYWTLLNRTNANFLDKFLQKGKLSISFFCCSCTVYLKTLVDCFDTFFKAVFSCKDGKTYGRLIGEFLNFGSEMPKLILDRLYVSILISFV